MERGWALLSKKKKIQSVAENLIRTKHLLEQLLGSKSENSLRLCLIIGLDYKTVFGNEEDRCFLL